MSQPESTAHPHGLVRPFKLSERRIWPGCIEIEVEGELDLAVTDRLRTALDAASDGRCHVLVGLGSCDFIDSCGLAVLAFASRALASRDRQLLLYGVHGQVRRLLSVVAATENGLRVAAGDLAMPAGLASAFDPGFRVTLANGESPQLFRSGATPIG